MLEAAGASSGSLAADTALAGQQAAAASAAEEAKWARMAGWARLLLAARPSALPQPPAPKAPVGRPPTCGSYLQSVTASLEELNPQRGGAGAAGASGRQQGRAALRCRLRDGREVAAELTADPSDPQLARLVLRPLAPGRIQAAITLKLAGSAAARRQAALTAALQAAECQAMARRSLLSSERAALLAGSFSPGRGTQPNPLTDLQRVLRSGLELRRGQPPAQDGQSGQAAAMALRRRLAQGVLALHRELQKAWRENK